MSVPPRLSATQRGQDPAAPTPHPPRPARARRPLGQSSAEAETPGQDAASPPSLQSESTARPVAAPGPRARQSEREGVRRPWRPTYEPGTSALDRIGGSEGVPFTMA